MSREEHTAIQKFTIIQEIESGQVGVKEAVRNKKTSTLPFKRFKKKRRAASV